MQMLDMQRRWEAPEYIYLSIYCDRFYQVGDAYAYMGESTTRKGSQAYVRTCVVWGIKARWIVSWHSALARCLQILQGSRDLSRWRPLLLAWLTCMHMYARALVSFTSSYSLSLPTCPCRRCEQGQQDCLQAVCHACALSYLEQVQ
jgi:hypothetical protein